MIQANWRKLIVLLSSSSATAGHAEIAPPDPDSPSQQLMGQTMIDVVENAHPSDDELANLLELYVVLLNKSNQEGDGIWSRFNILVALQGALFAGYAYVSTHLRDFNVPIFDMLALICVAGILTSGWSFYVLNRLWAWQQYWRIQLACVERGFPDAPHWPRPFSPKSPDDRLLNTDPGVKRSLHLGSTQPFMTLIFLAWALLLSYRIWGNA